MHVNWVDLLATFRLAHAPAAPKTIAGTLFGRGGGLCGDFQCAAHQHGHPQSGLGGQQEAGSQAGRCMNERTRLLFTATISLAKGLLTICNMGDMCWDARQRTIDVCPWMSVHTVSEFHDVILNACRPLRWASPGCWTQWGAVPPLHAHAPV